MWFPYSLPVQWKAEGERGHIDESLADNTAREFLIGFYLRNPVTREWQVELQLKEPRWVPVTEPAKGMSVGYYPNETGQLSEIIYRIQESNSAIAVRLCYAHVSQMLSCWSALKGRGFAIAGFRIADLKHEAKWRMLPHRPSTLSFDLSLCEAMPKSYSTITTLYREARNSPSDIYRFLCCRKILGMWVKRADPFKLLQARAEKLEMELANGHYVDQEMLLLSGMTHYRPDLEGIGFGELLDSLAEWHQWTLRAVIDEELPARLGDYECDLELSSVANLVDLAVHRILASEIKGWQRIERAQGDKVPGA
jgi:hypothetical protein